MWESAYCMKWVDGDSRNFFLWVGPLDIGPPLSLLEQLDTV